jgi:hypothetical protein
VAARVRDLQVLGVVWAIAFYRWYRDDPADHPSVNKARLALLPPQTRPRW